MLKKLKFIFGLFVFAFGFNAFAEVDATVEDNQEIVDEVEEVVDTMDEDMGEEIGVETEPVTVSDEKIENEIADKVSSDALNNYQVEGSLFEKITLLEQDKIVLQLEKERAQLDLELERLNAEKLKLQMELDTLSGRAEHQQQELEVAKAQLEAQAEQLKRQKEALDEQVTKPVVAQPAPKAQKATGDIGTRYKLVNIVGVGNQLQATIQEISSGQNKRVFVGKDLDGYTVKSISLNDGIVFEKDGEVENINVGK